MAINFKNCLYRQWRSKSCSWRKNICLIVKVTSNSGRHLNSVTNRCTYQVAAVKKMQINPRLSVKRTLTLSCWSGMLPKTPEPGTAPLWILVFSFQNILGKIMDKLCSSLQSYYLYHSIIILGNWRPQATVSSVLIVYNQGDTDAFLSRHLLCVLKSYKEQVHNLHVPPKSKAKRLSIWEMGNKTESSLQMTQNAPVWFLLTYVDNGCCKRQKKRDKVLPFPNRPIAFQFLHLRH